MKPNETITGERYPTQLMRLSQALRKNGHNTSRDTKNDNAWPDVAKPVKNYLETLKWEVLPRPPYSPGIAPSDYYLLWSMAHGLADQQFRSYKDIRVLPERWAKVVANDGQYFEWFIGNHFFTIK